MAVGLPAKTTYADGDVFSASDINDTNGTLNLVGQTTNFYAGKNKIINGDFRINQRGFTSVTIATYTFDRWKTNLAGGTVTYTPETFTLGTAPVAGYEGSTFLQVVTSGQSAAGDFAQLLQPIESVRTFAGQTVTFSFWAKAGSGTPKLALEFSQFFGSTGSPSLQVNTYGGQVTLSTSWARYSVTVAIPSISGKTLGTGNDDRLEPKIWFSAGSTFDARTGTLGIQNNTFSIWGVQVEAGSVATAFQTATGTIQGELAACQRYYYRWTSVSNFAQACLSTARGSTQSDGQLFAPVTMRVAPTSLDFSSLLVSIAAGGSNTAITAMVLNQTAPNNLGFTATTAGSFGSVGAALTVIANNSATAFLGFSAEL